MRKVFIPLFLVTTLVSVCSAQTIKQPETYITTPFNDSIIKEDGPLNKTMDWNKDGESDHWIYFLRDGGVQKVLRDLDFDGHIDSIQWTFLRENKIGQFDKILYDENVDGKIERIEYYDNQNKVIRTETNPDNQ